MKKVAVFGTFDRLHPGHKYLLDEASAEGLLHVIVARDKTVLVIKKRMPEQTESQRLDAVKAAYPDADVRLGDNDDYSLPLRQIDPDLILLGYDQELPPGVSSDDLRCEVRRMAAHRPDVYKSSLRRGAN